MNSHVRRFYRKFVDEEAPIRLYHEVIALHETPSFAFEEVVAKIPALPKGWYELAKLPTADRIEFTRDFWLSRLPYVPHVHRFLQTFFAKLDDVGVYATQLRFDTSFECEIVYSLQDGSCFYHGGPPCSERKLRELNSIFGEILPADYLAFLQIHDGFSKHSDTGVIKTKFLKDLYQQLQIDLAEDDISCGGQPVNPRQLIPFYESFGQPSYQCFYANWSPADGVGNVYYSLIEKVISDVVSKPAALDNLAFPTFLDWLIFYLEGVEG